MPVHVVRAMFIIIAWLFASEELHDAAFWNSFAVLTSLGHEGLLRPALVKPALSGMYLCYICEQYSRHQLQCRACGSDTPMCPECFVELHGQCRQLDQEWLFPSARNGSWTAVVTDGENRVVLDSCPLFVSLLVCKVAKALVDDASCRSPLLVVCPAAGWAVARCCFLDFDPVQHFGGGANFRL